MPITIINPFVFASGSPPGYFVNAMDFDGSTSIVSRGAGLSSVVDGKAGLFSCWFRLDTLPVANDMYILDSDPNRIQVWLTKSGTDMSVVVRHRDSTGTNAWFSNTDLIIQADSTWHHLLMAWKMDVGGAHWIYVDDVSEELTPTTFTDLTLDYTNTNWHVGAQGGPADFYNGCLAEVYLDLNRHLDLSVESNRRFFITSDLKARDLTNSNSSSWASGGIPTVYLRNGVSTFGTNLGNGGDFTPTGLQTCNTRPTGEGESGGGGDPPATPQHIETVGHNETDPTTGPITITIPATCQDGDILFAAFTNRNSTTNPSVSDNDSGTWTLFAEQAGDIGSASREGTIWTRVATGTTAGKTVTANGFTNSCAGLLSVYRDMTNTATTQSGEDNPSGTPEHGALNTGANEMLCLWVFNVLNDIVISSPTCTDPGAMTLRLSKTSAGGSDCAVAHASIVKTASGSTGTISWTQSANVTASIAASFAGV